MAEELNESAEVLKIHDLRPAPGSKKLYKYFLLKSLFYKHTKIQRKHWL